MEAGNRTYFASEPIIRWGGRAKLIIGAYCSIARNVIIYLGGNHPTDAITTFPIMPFPQEHYTKGDVIIGNDVWIGDDVRIMSGVTIGDGAIIGNSSVVASDVPPYATVIGNPARIVKYRFSVDQIERLLKIKWWEWPNEKVDRAKDILWSKDIDSLEKFT